MAGCRRPALAPPRQPARRARWPDFLRRRQSARASDPIGRIAIAFDPAYSPPTPRAEALANGPRSWNRHHLNVIVTSSQKVYLLTLTFLNLDLVLPERQAGTDVAICVLTKPSERSGCGAASVAPVGQLWLCTKSNVEFGFRVGSGRRRSGIESVAECRRNPAGGSGMDHFVSRGYQFAECRGWFGSDSRRRHALLRIRRRIAHLPGERYEQHDDRQWRSCSRNSNDSHQRRGHIGYAGSG
jgi:hypothetical protein